MKKVIAFLVSLTLALALCGCGNKTQSNESVISHASSKLESSSAVSTVSETSSTVSSQTSSANSAASKNPESSQSTSSAVKPQTPSTSTETINILRQDNAVDYKGKIITSYAILNSDYSVYKYNENTWDSRRNISVYDGKLFYYNTVAEKYQTRNAIFTCDENGNNVKEIVKNAAFGVYTIYQGRIYYICEKYENDKWERYLCSSNISGSDEKVEIPLKTVTQVYYAVVKDSVLYCWVYEGETLCIAKFEPKSKNFEILKRYSDPSTRHRSELHLVGNDIYYHFGDYIYKVNFKGEDTVLPIAQNESETYLRNETVIFCEQGIMVIDFGNQTAYDPVDFFTFDDLSTKKVAPKSIYAVVKRNTENPSKSFITCQKKDKIIFFE